MNNLEKSIKNYLESDKKITVKWNCGSDEAVITILIDGELMQDNKAFDDDLSMYIINRLSLPDVGEFELVGEGEIFEENGKLYLECDSITTYEDEEETEEDDVWAEIREIESDYAYSGKFELFNKK